MGPTGSVLIAANGHPPSTAITFDSSTADMDRTNVFDSTKSELVALLAPPLTCCPSASQSPELVPRFDMKGQSILQFASGTANNLFVHDSWCAAAGPARGCGACSAATTGFSCTATCAAGGTAYADDATNQADVCP